MKPPSKMSIRSFHAASRCLKVGCVQVTLFSKSNCGLCNEASNVMEKVLQQEAQIDYSVVKIDDPKNNQWWEQYCLDVPVLHIKNPSNEGSLLKVFHRLDHEDVLKKIKSVK
ncbi:YDR286C [Zygosaccharomyces parabailii]|nr:YDR286C [Zygosaccharomyces parabailii]